MAHRPRVGAVGVVLVALSLGACNDYQLHGGSDATVLPALVTSPDLLAFDGVAAGAEKSGVIVLGNEGTAGLSITGIELQGPSSFTLVSGGDLLSLSVDQTAELALVYSPLQANEEGRVVIHSSDPNRPEAIIPLLGTGLYPALAIDPDPVDFLEAGACEGQLEVALRNIGGAPLSITAVSTISDTVTLTEPWEQTRVVDPGDETVVELQAEYVAAADGTLWVTSDDPRRLVSADITSAPIEDFHYGTANEVAFDQAFSFCPSTETVRFDAEDECGFHGDFTIDGVEITNPAFQVTWPTRFPHTYSHDEPVELQLLVAPVHAGYEFGWMYVSSQDSSQVDTFFLNAPTGLTTLDAVPSPLAFGDVPVGCSDDHLVLVSNPSECPLTFTSINIGSGAYTITERPPLPVTLEQWDEIPVTVHFEASTAGDYRAEIRAITAEGILTTVPVTGVAGEGWAEDTFHRDGPWDQVDILFYVDGSCSMTDDQRRLATQSSAFVDALEALDLDWQLGVVANTNACIHGGIITSDTASAASTFSDAVREAYGWDNEYGLSLSARALSRSCNEGFHREGAGLRVVMVSDEPDQSAESWSTLLAQIQAIEPATRMNAIAGDYPSGCGRAVAGVGYYEATLATGGLFMSICESDWAGYVDLIADDALSDPEAPYPLTYAPVVSSITVTIDAVETSSWTYSSGTNSLAIEGVEADQEVVIRYQRACA